MRRSDRTNREVQNETLGNLSHLPEAVIDLSRRALRGEQLRPVEDQFLVVHSPHHGHVEAVLTAVRRLDFVRLLPRPPSREPAQGAGGHRGQRLPSPGSGRDRPDLTLETQRTPEQQRAHELLETIDEMPR